jgi:HD superfamily phosphodiesterase
MGKSPSVYEMIELKRVHSIKVAEISKDIASHLGWSNAKVNAAYILGLLHDIVRFSQYAEFGTFADPLTVDHGERGFDIVREFNLLGNCGDKETDSILKGILYHNDRFIPDDVPEHALPFLKLIRDADKLDIYRIMIEFISLDSTQDHLRTALSLEPGEKANPHAIEEIFSRKTVSSTNILSQTDFTLMKLSWIFDINYRYSLERIKSGGYIELFASMLPQDDEAREAGKFVCDCLEKMLSLTPSTLL